MPRDVSLHFQSIAADDPAKALGALVQVEGGLGHTAIDGICRASPMRWRRRVIGEQPNGASWRKCSSPQKCWQ